MSINLKENTISIDETEKVLLCFVSFFCRTMLWQRMIPNIDKISFYEDLCNMADNGEEVTEKNVLKLYEELSHYSLKKMSETIPSASMYFLEFYKALSKDEALQLLRQFVAFEAISYKVAEQMEKEEKEGNNKKTKAH